MQIGSAPIIQHGYVVTDAEKSARLWSERLGIGPFYLVEQTLDEYSYRQRPVKDVKLRIAVSYWRDLQIELLQPLCSNKTFYSESLKAAPEKLNHYAVLVPDIEAAVREHQLEKHLVHKGRLGGIHFTYLGNYTPDGVALELMQVDAKTQEVLGALHALCRMWDRTRPVRLEADLMVDLGALSSKAAKDS